MLIEPQLRLVPAAPDPSRDGSAERRPRAPLRRLVALALVLVIGGLALGLRLVALNSTGFNSDEAVYAGQAAGIAGDSAISAYFPVFRAHPMLFQTALSVLYRWGVSDLAGRLLSVAIGLATVWLTYLVGKLLYGRKAGAVAALLMAVMPYHVVVTRQVLLDGPMALFATLTLYLVARYADSRQPAWLWAAGGAMGLTFLSKETAVILLGSVYAFFALAPQVKVRLRDLALSFAAFVLVAAPYPMSIFFSGKSATGQSFLAWQLFRRPNHPWTFYPTTVPQAIGLLAVAAAGIGILLLRGERSWRETLLSVWVAVPAVFFELWPVKGFQYLLPVAVPVAVLAARTLARAPLTLASNGRRERGRALPATVTAVLAGAVALSMAAPAWARIQPATTGQFLAGSGGVPGGREAGAWVRANIPEGARILALGPSMANIIQFYGHRKAYGLSVSPNPLHRNPTYEPLPNPDHLIRVNELQYLVWDSFSASRSKFFSQRLLRFVERYHGREVHRETVAVKTADGKRTDKPVIVIYEVRP